MTTPGPDDHRLAAQARIVALLYRREEGVEVGVEHRGLGLHERMFAQQAPVAGG